MAELAADDDELDESGGGIGSPWRIWSSTALARTTVAWVRSS